MLCIKSEEVLHTVKFPFASFTSSFNSRICSFKSLRFMYDFIIPMGDHD